MSRRSMLPAAQKAAISTRVHAMFDYVLPFGIAAMATSRRFGGPVRTVMTVGPIWHLGYTLLTRHEGGMAPRAGAPGIGMPAHLACDAAGALSFLGAGLLLRRQKASHRVLLAAIGLGELAIIAFTDRTPHAASIEEALD
jgi:hypothetical protein